MSKELIKEDIMRWLIGHDEEVRLIRYDSMYPGNLKSNIEIYKKACEDFPIVDVDKRTFMSLVHEYIVNGNINNAFCSICGKLCKSKGDYSFHDTCSRECGRIIAARNTSLTYKGKSEEEREAIKIKRRETNLSRFGAETNLLSKEAIESRKKRFNGSISCFNDPELQRAIREKNAKKHNGLDNPFQWEESKAKIKQAKLEKYGDVNYNNPNKAKETCLAYYGTEYYMQSEEGQERFKSACLEHFGTTSPFSNAEVKAKIAKTNEERYGKRYPMQVEEIRQKSIASSLERYGVEWNCLSKQCQVQGGVISKINLEWQKNIEDLGYKVELEKPVSKFSYDLYLPERNLLIDINPTISHQSTMEIPTHFGVIPPKDRLYHINKHKLAKDNGFECIMIWDWDDREKILNFLAPKEEVRLKQCKICEISFSEAHAFLNKYHLQGTCQGQDVCIGLLYGEEIISVMTFGQSRYNSNYQWEWLRYASCKKVHRAVSAMFDYFITNHKPESIISYCDQSKFDGIMFGRLGFIKQRDPEPSLHYYNKHDMKHYTANQVRRIGACRCLGIPQIDYASTGKDNNAIMIENGYLEVYDCGQATYVWRKS